MHRGTKGSSCRSTDSLKDTNLPLILLLTLLIARPSTVARKVNSGAKHADLCGLFNPGLCCCWQRSDRTPPHRTTFLLQRRAQLPCPQWEALQIPLLCRGEPSSHPHRQLNPIDDKVLGCFLSGSSAAVFNLLPVTIAPATQGFLVVEIPSIRLLTGCTNPVMEHHKGL